MNIKIDSAILQGDLTRPENEELRGLVIFAHGSGSSRLSPRNRLVAKVLQDNGFATLLFDLLTEDEDKDYNARFDVDLLAERLEKVTLWVLAVPDFKTVPTGYFGASTGAAAALIAVARLGKAKAVVSRGGRPDMAIGYLRKVDVPTLLLVGSEDREVIKLNRYALKEIRTKTKELIIVRGATHLFEEPGTLEQVAEHAVKWFQGYL